MSNLDSIGILKFTDLENTKMERHGIILDSIRLKIKDISKGRKTQN